MTDQARNGEYDGYSYPTETIELTEDNFDEFTERIEALNAVVERHRKELGLQ